MTSTTHLTRIFLKFIYLFNSFFTDLPKDDEVFTPPSRTATMNKKTSQNFAESETIYKTVDFERTKAFNQTRKDREETRLDTTDHRTS